MRRLTGNAKGFTLLELLIAVFLLAVGLMAVVSMQEVAIKSDVISNRLSAGAGIAQRVTEELLSRRFDDPVFSTPGGPFLYIFDNGAGNISVQGAETYLATYTVATSNPGAGSSRIDVNVGYGSANTIIATYTAFKRVE